MNRLDYLTLFAHKGATTAGYVAENTIDPLSLTLTPASRKHYAKFRAAETNQAIRKMRQNEASHYGKGSATEGGRGDGKQGGKGGGKGGGKNGKSGGGGRGGSPGGRAGSE